VGKRLFRPGLNRRPPAKALELDSVMTRFALEGVPILHLSGISELAKRHGLPLTPQRLPAIGEGIIYYREEYNLWAAAGILAVLAAMLVVLIRLDLGHRLFQTASRAQAPQHPQRMV